jgi:hypothetical protein
MQLLVQEHHCVLPLLFISLGTLFFTNSKIVDQGGAQTQEHLSAKDSSA